MKFNPKPKVDFEYVSLFRWIRREVKEYFERKKMEIEVEKITGKSFLNIVIPKDIYRDENNWSTPWKGEHVSFSSRFIKRYFFHIRYE